MSFFMYLASQNIDKDILIVIYYKRTVNNGGILKYFPLFRGRYGSANIGDFRTVYAKMFCSEICNVPSHLSRRLQSICYVMAHIQNA